MTSCKAVTRYLCSELVLVARLDGTGRIGLRANLEEIGETFAELIAERPFPRKSKIRITSETHQMEGTVESCVLDRPLGYVVKVQLAPKSHWSERWFTPKHLLRVPAASTAKVSTLEMASGY